ncbi:hypothetical protein [Pseudostreptobacillus hongkongensis]|uniref:hypothetical protein n=1 Tax=Pseudostreptobacillus hongkongensis TaxID=1162717 RepID=UPI000834D993|nr:hypothetical protein [Pseudostreptobacillus hongkongensis]
MEETMKKIEIEDFITIKILELNKEYYVCFIDSYNEKYFYIDDNNRIYTHQSTNIFYYHLYFQKAKLIYSGHLDDLEKAIYKLHKQLTFKIDRATENQDYYFISSKFKVERITDFRGLYSTSHYKSYNYFLTENQAKRFASKMKDYLIELWKEELKNEN